MKTALAFFSNPRVMCSLLGLLAAPWLIAADFRPGCYTSTGQPRPEQTLTNAVCGQRQYCVPQYPLCRAIYTDCGVIPYPYQKTTKRRMIGWCVPQKGSRNCKRCTLGSARHCAFVVAYQRRSTDGTCLEECRYGEVPVYTGNCVP